MPSKVSAATSLTSVAKLRAESRICPNAGGEEASSLRRARLVFDFVFKTFAFDVASSTAPLDSDGQAPLPTPATSTKPPLHDALLARSCAGCRGRYSDRSHHETSGTSAVHGDGSDLYCIRKFFFTTKHDLGKCARKSILSEGLKPLYVL